ncbi:MAG: hypothetical protein KGQ51_09150 [Planctomycetes bacterium]|nr:hypothetical protein [Planctomycetota bacterium]
MELEPLVNPPDTPPELPEAFRYRRKTARSSESCSTNFGLNHSKVAPAESWLHDSMMMVFASPEYTHHVSNSFQEKLTNCNFTHFVGRNSHRGSVAKTSTMFTSDPSTFSLPTGPSPSGKAAGTEAFGCFPNVFEEFEWQLP